MYYAKLKTLLSANAGVINSLTVAVTPEQARWKPDSDRWSILEVINHLYDEEREDFRLQLDIMLHRPENPWPPLDPMNWVTTRNYNKLNMQTSVARFLEERRFSLGWLESLKSPDWDKTVQAPWGPFKAGDMFASWVVHDQWHIQQLIQLRRDYTINLSAPYSVQYAGSL